MTSDARVQTVRNAWINALRAEVLRKGVPAELARIAAVGVWIATYADADGGGAFPSRETLGQLAGCAPETVTRTVKVLTAVGMLARKRRPNASSVYQLLMPVARPNWSEHIGLYTDTRQRRAHAEKKAQQAAEVVARLEAEAQRTESVDAVRTASMDCVPDSVHGGGSEPAEEVPDRVHGHPRTASVDAVRTASMAGVYQYNHPYGADPDPDHTPPGVVPQLQEAAASAVEDLFPSEAQAPALHTVPTSPGTGGQDGGQRPLLLSVRPPAHVGPDTAQLRATATPEDIRRAIADLGQREAIALYGWRLVNPHITEGGEARAQ